MHRSDEEGARMENGKRSGWVGGKDLEESTIERRMLQTVENARLEFAGMLPDGHLHEILSILYLLFGTIDRYDSIFSGCKELVEQDALAIFHGSTCSSI